MTDESTPLPDAERLREVARLRELTEYQRTGTISAMERAELEALGARLAAARQRELDELLKARRRDASDSNSDPDPAA
jgi:hypothetical protein